MSCILNMCTNKSSLAHNKEGLCYNWITGMVYFCLECLYYKQIPRAFHHFLKTEEKLLGSSCWGNSITCEM